MILDFFLNVNISDIYFFFVYNLILFLHLYKNVLKF